MLHLGSKEVRNKENSTSHYLKLCSIVIQVVAVFILIGLIVIAVLCWGTNTKIQIVFGDNEAQSIPPPLPPQSDFDDIFDVQPVNSFAAAGVPGNMDEDYQKPVIAQLNALQDKLTSTGEDVTLANNQIDKIIKQLPPSGDDNSKVFKGIAAAAKAVAGNIDKLTSDNAVDITSGVLGTIGGIAMLAPPVGEAVSAVFGLASAIVGLFGGSSGPSMNVVIQDAVDKAVKQIDNKIDKAQFKLLKEQVEAIGEEYDTQIAFLVSLNSPTLSPVTMNSMQLNVPNTLGAKAYDTLGIALKGMANQNDFMTDVSKIEAAIQTLPQFARLGIMRTLLFTQLQTIYGLQGDKQMYFSTGVVIKTHQKQELNVFQKVNGNGGLLWINDDTLDTINGYVNYRNYRQSISKSKTQAPVKSVELMIIDWDTPSAELPDFIDTWAIVSNDCPLTGLQF
eukprot:285018_1